MKILIVGLGAIGKKHVAAINALKPNADLYAYRSTNNASAAQGITNIYTLDDESLKFDFAVISNPTHLHYEFIEKLSNLFIPLFVEKPVASDLNNIDALVNLINKKKLVTYVACNLRFHPCLRFLKNKFTIEPPAVINEVNIYCGSYLPDWRPNADFRKIYSANKEMGGGVHLDLFHELDYLVWLFGMPVTSQSLLRNKSSLNINAIDYANYNLIYDKFVANVTLNYYRPKVKRVMEIIFDKSTWLVDLIRAEITDDDGNIIFNSPGFNVLDTYKLQMEYFLDVLNSRTTSMNQVSDSVEVLKICLLNE